MLCTRNVEDQEPLPKNALGWPLRRVLLVTRKDWTVLVDDPRLRCEIYCEHQVMDVFDVSIMAA
jgi:hypothetical protein